MKGFKYLLIFIFGFVFCYFLIVYNLKIEITEKTEMGELLTISIFGNSWNYYNEF
jgi:hypothetical protein